MARTPPAISLREILAIADLNPEAAARLAARGTGPRDSDPRPALAAFAIPIQATAMWRWPFAKDVDYLACATVTRADSLRRVLSSYPGIHH